MTECYWLALARDVPYTRHGEEPVTAAAVADLRRLEGYRDVDARTLFRSDLPGVMAGPYISQFLLQPYTFGGTPVQQRYRTTMPARDHPVRGGHLRRAPRAGPGRAGGQPCDEGGLVPQVAGAPAVPSRGGRRTHPQPPDRSGRLPAPPQADRLGGAVLPGTAATCAPRPTPRAAPPTPPTPVPRPPRRGRGERAQGVLQRSLGDPKPVVPSDDGLSLQPGRASR
jgi:hypothetical protein